MNEQVINQQQQLLAIYRRTLVHYLTQQAMLGTANTPPEVTHGIEEARENIHRIKTFLRSVGIQVVDHPDDEIEGAVPQSIRNRGKKQMIGTIPPATQSVTRDLPNNLSPEIGFWLWFEANSARLMNFAFGPDAIPNEQDPLIQELSSELEKVAEGLTFELSSTTDFGREFIVSANGIHKYFSAVIRLMALAPQLPDWRFIAFRPPIDTHFILTYRKYEISGDDIWFTATPNGPRQMKCAYLGS